MTCNDRLTAVTQETESEETGMDKLDNFMKVSWGYVEGDRNIHVMTKVKVPSSIECVLGLEMLARAIYDELARDIDPALAQKVIFESIKAVMEHDYAEIEKECVTIRTPQKKS